MYESRIHLKLAWRKLLESARAEPFGSGSFLGLHKSRLIRCLKKSGNSEFVLFFGVVVDEQTIDANHLTERDAILPCQVHNLAVIHGRNKSQLHPTLNVTLTTPHRNCFHHALRPVVISYISVTFLSEFAGRRRSSL